MSIRLVRPPAGEDCNELQTPLRKIAGRSTLRHDDLLATLLAFGVGGVAG